MLFIARRYLFSEKSHSVINIIAGVSVVSVAIPVAAIIILLSIFNGFGSLAEGMNESIDGELTITPKQGQYFKKESLDLSLIEGVKDYAFVTETNVMLEHDGREEVVTLRGVDDLYTSVVPIDQYTLFGDFTPRIGDLDRLIIGNAMAAKLGVRNLRTTWINLYSIRESRLSAFAPMVNFVQDSIKIAGVYMVDMESEGRYAYGSQRLVEELSGREGEVTSAIISSTEGVSTEKLRDNIREAIGEEYKVRSREEMNPLLYDIIRYEKWGIIFISLMVMTLASFSLIGIVAMLIIEKRDDMTTLRTMGATWADVRRVFFIQGGLISGLGSVIGVVIGVGVTLLQQYFGVVKLPAGGFVIDAYPVDLQLGDVVGVVVATTAIAFILNWIVTREMIKK